MKPNSPAYISFIARLNAGHYRTPRGANSGIGNLHSLSTVEQVSARTEVLKYFNKQALPAHRAGTTAVPNVEAAPPATEPKEPTPTQEAATEGSLTTFFSHLRNLENDAIVKLRMASSGNEAVSYSDTELTELTGLILEYDVMPAFTGLLYGYAARLSPDILNIEVLGQHPRFFSYANVILGARVGNQEMLQALFKRMAVEIDRRASDPVQVEAFEKCCLTVGKRIDLRTFGPVIVEYASWSHVFVWLGAMDSAPEDAIHQFAHRMMSLYINGDVDAKVLMRLQDLNSDVRITEELIRCLLVQRQLGDALIIAGAAPENQKAQLYHVLHPVVQRHGDAIGLITFGIAFPRLCDRHEIKELVARFFEPDVNAGIDNLIDGVAPYDYFNSMPSIMSTDQVAQLRESLLTGMGHQPTRKPSAQGAVPPFVQDLLDRMARGG